MGSPLQLRIDGKSMRLSRSKAKLNLDATSNTKVSIDTFV